MMNEEASLDCNVDVEGVHHQVHVPIEQPVSDKVSVGLNCKPFIGMEFDTITESEEFWKNYGYETGFGGRIKNTNIRKKDNIVTSRVYVCSRQGVKAEDNRRINSKPRFETRCNCGVLMSIQLKKETGKYYVTNFVEEHNHDLEGKKTIHQLRAHQNIDEIQAQGIDVGLRAGLGPTMTHRYMAIEAGGSENLSFTKQYMKSRLRNINSKNKELGEASMVLDYFEEKSKQNPDFFHAYQVDTQGKITNIFWADPKMLADYEMFGDVLSFDTTFGTNKESRPLGIFSGFNNHRQIVVFGGALLYDETAASFEWLFTVFLECHDARKPGIIFTDQDAAMKKALSEVMPTVRHALCAWHICKNALDNLSGHLNVRIDSFMIELKHCIYESFEADEFVLNWSNMAEQFGLQNHKWLQGLYEKKSQFCLSFFKDTFTAGARTTQISESINGRLKKDLGSGLTMKSFFNGFDLFLAEVRKKESDMQCFSRQTSPHLTNKYSSILKQVASIYTPRIFKLFNDQFDLGCAVRLDKNNISDHSQVIIATEGGRTFKINYDPSSLIISCSCCRYEMHGYLCAHILRVFDVCNVDKVPDKYIMKRWTLNATSSYKVVVDTLPGKTNAQKISILNNECRRVIHRVCGDDELFEGVRRIINSAHFFIDECLISKGKGETSNSPKSFEPINVSNGIVTGLKKKIVRKQVVKRRIIPFTEGGKRAKRTRAMQQKRLKSQQVVDQPLSQVLEAHIDDDDELIRLTL